jgi:serine/threonine protein kinase
MKVQVLTNKSEMRSFEQELDRQESFGEFAPKVFERCVTKDDRGREYGIIVMERLGDEIDAYLMKQRTKQELDFLANGIVKILEFCRHKGITHGDLALFNIAFNSRGQVVFLDFDRAAPRFHPDVDFWRLYIEMFVSTQSNGTKKIHPKNLAYLKTALPHWAHALGLTGIPKVTTARAEDIWTQAYTRYCKAEKIKCLES